MSEAGSITMGPARLSDLNNLVEIENRCFDIDRMSRRSMKHMITKGNCDFVVARQAGVIIGYILVLYHHGTNLARVYSIAVLPEYRGKKLGELLLHHVEKLACERECIYMRLEVHPNNASAISMYERNGYHPFGMYKNYYEDNADALRFEKRILYPKDQKDFVRIPYYQQTTDFTCGPASLMMAMKALDSKLSIDRSMELQIWREATTIYMTSGHGGCSPLGLALAAHERGFRVEVFINSKEPLFVDGVRSENKKSVMELSHADFMRQIEKTDIVVDYSTISVDGLVGKMEQGGIPIVLISSYRFFRLKAPHWVLVSGADKTFVYIHDPEVDDKTYRSAMDNVYLPINRQTFDKVFRFGRTGLRSCVILYSPRKK